MPRIKELLGVYVARVVDVGDPENLGRIRISSVESGVDAWARVATLFTGNSGGWFVPEIDDEVVVAFEAGDARRPIVVGSLWKGNRPPDSLRVVDGHGNSVTFEPAGVTLKAAAKVTVQASQVAIAAGVVTIDAGMSKFAGTIQADTLITNSVISASYTPGAGNLW